MQSLRQWSGVSLFALLVAACGGGGDDVGGNTVPVYTGVVSFGDSLSDVGSYRTAGVAALGGGKYTVNGNPIWVERIATDRGLPAPCAAQVGLLSTGPLAPLAQAPAFQSGCTGYAQGGSRVTNPVGPGNAALLALGSDDGRFGLLTVPVAAQIARHLQASGGRFGGRELVTLLAGGNDVFTNLAAIGALPGQISTQVAVANMGAAGAEMAGYVRTQLLANGAKYVVVVNLPDVSQTPFAATVDAPTRTLVNQMVTTFNAQLAAGLSGAADVLQVDAYTRGRQQTADPASFGFSNGTAVACNLPATAFNGVTLGSLICTASTLVAGDVSRYAYADAVHPTPYGHQLLADLVLQRMRDVGWR